MAVAILGYTFSMACKFWGIVFAKIHKFQGAVSDVKWHTPVTCLLKLPPPPPGNLQEVTNPAAGLYLAPNGEAI